MLLWLVFFISYLNEVQSPGLEHLVKGEGDYVGANGGEAAPDEPGASLQVLRLGAHEDGIGRVGCTKTSKSF